jgi:hypothetical protein
MALSSLSGLDYQRKNTFPTDSLWTFKAVCEFNHNRTAD